LDMVRSNVQLQIGMRDLSVRDVTWHKGQLLLEYCIKNPHDRPLIKDLLNHNGEWNEHYIYNFLEPSIFQDILK